MGKMQNQIPGNLREDDILPYGSKYKINPRATCGRAMHAPTGFISF